jgi:hypothetical protein
LDKDVTIGHKAVVGRIDPNDPDTLGITSVGKNTQVSSGLHLGRNVTVGPDVRPQDFPVAGLADGRNLARKTSPLDSVSI